MGHNICSTSNYLDVQRGREGGLWISGMFHAWMPLMFKEGGRENIMDFELLWCFMRDCLWCSKREGGRTSWTLNYCDVSCVNVFDVQRGGRENIRGFELLWCFMRECLWCSKREGVRTSWTLKYCDVSCVNVFDVRRGREGDDHGLWITVMFHAWMSLIFKEGGRDDRTSWTLNYFDVSCVNYSNVSIGRDGGQNIMDFELLWCFMREFLWCSKREHKDLS